MYDKIKPKNNRKSETEIQTDTIIKNKPKKKQLHMEVWIRKHWEKKAKRWYSRMSSERLLVWNEQWVAASTATSTTMVAAHADIYT